MATPTVQRARGGLTLLVLSGPAHAACSVLPEGSITLGRGRSCEICLAFPEVSRRHAVILGRGGGWYVLDQGSMTGTHVNGVRVPSGAPTALSGGDLLRIGPASLRVSTGGGRAPTATIDDSGSRVDAPGRVESVRLTPSADRRLKLLADCLATLAGAGDERTLAETTLRAVLDESGYARGAILRRIDGGHAVEVVAERRRERGDDAPFAFSRSLVERASSGSVAILASDASPEFGRSVADLRIHSALCAPVLLGGGVEGYLYLDARGHESSVRAEADGFCEAFAQAYGLALANLKRSELERRQRALQAELESAREAQRFILPPPRADFGFLRYAMEMRAGLFVAGDLFDAVALGDGRVAVALGDVSGHGAGSAMVMAAVQAHLHALVSATGDPARAAAGANLYLAQREHSGLFVTLWLGVFAPDGTLDYVDAGHGYWFLFPRGGAPTPPDAGDGAIPLGIDRGASYRVRRARIGPGDRVMLYSDGLVDQPGPEGVRFGRGRIAAATPGEAPADDVRAVFDAVSAFAGGVALTDDATAACIEFVGAWGVSASG